MAPKFPSFLHVRLPEFQRCWKPSKSRIDPVKFGFWKYFHIFTWFLTGVTNFLVPFPFRQSKETGTVAMSMFSLENRETSPSSGTSVSRFFGRKPQSRCRSESVLNYKQIFEDKFTPYQKAGKIQDEKFSLLFQMLRCALESSFSFLKLKFI